MVVYLAGHYEIFGWLETVGIPNAEVAVHSARYEQACVGRVPQQKSTKIRKFS